MTETIRLTVAQAVVKFIANQYTEIDGERRRFIPAALGIFGHGNVAGLGQALEMYSDDLPFVQGRNEQSLVHMATGFAKQSRRHATLAVTASIGPGAANMLTGAALATINRLPVLLLPGDTFATRRQGPVLQQLEDPAAPDVTVNDAFRPLSRFFDRITRPEQLLTALPGAFRVLANPVETGAAVISLPQDVQSHAHDFPVEFFRRRVWKIRRPLPDPAEIAEVARLIREAEKPLIIAGGGVIYSQATPELESLVSATGIPVSETFGGKGAVQQRLPELLGGIGLEGNPATNVLAREADLIVHVGTRLTDFATASQSLFAHPDVRFASINVTELDAVKQGAVACVADAKLGLAQLAEALAGHRVSSEWTQRVTVETSAWQEERAKVLDPAPIDRADYPDAPVTDAVITQPQLIGLLQEDARAGDTILTAAGGPPGDLLKSWDATEGRFAHLEFGFSCMGYEIPAALGARLAESNPEHRILAFIGDGTFTLSPSELVTAAQESLPVTIVISENHGYQVIRRLQMISAGTNFGNEFRYRPEGENVATTNAPRLEGDYLDLDHVSTARGLGATAMRATTVEEVRDALRASRSEKGPVVIVVPTIPHVDLPGAGAWWDVAPAEVPDSDALRPLREAYEAGLATQRWHG